MDIDANLKKQSASFVFFLAFTVNLLIGIIDYVTGYRFHMSAYYLIPVFISVWYANIFMGVVMSTMSWLMMIFVYTATSRHHHYLVHLWNLTSLFIIYNIFAFLLSNLKLALAQRRESLSFMRAFTGLVPECASCKNMFAEDPSHTDDPIEENLIAERQEALAKVRTLTNTISSCASCNKTSNSLN